MPTEPKGRPEDSVMASVKPVRGTAARSASQPSMNPRVSSSVFGPQVTNVVASGSDANRCTASKSVRRYSRRTSRGVTSCIPVASPPDRAQAAWSARGARGALTDVRNSLASCRGALRTVVSASQPLGSESRSTLCQALATCFGIGAAW